jgi:predicted metal-dependent enzyme (double-stranded beta helix superfamily)
LKDEADVSHLSALARDSGLGATVKTTEDLVAACVEAIGEPEPRGAIRDILTEFVTSRATTGHSDDPAVGLRVLYRSADLTVLDVIWPPLMTLFPHDHRMWAAIGIYGGREDNAFYRRDGESLVSSGGRELADGAVLLLGDDVIHSVHNPARSSYTGAIHVYGGDFVGTPRSQWDPATLREEPYDLDAVRQEFDRAEQNFRSSAG